MVSPIAMVVRAVLVSSALAQADPSAAQKGSESDLFVRDAASVFVTQCVGCHGAERTSAGLRLDTPTAIKAGGNNGPIVAPGDSAGSLLVLKLRGESGDRMPLDRLPLADETIEAIARWVDAGAKTAPLPDDARLIETVAEYQLRTLSSGALAEQRLKLARAAWAKAFPERGPHEAASLNFQALGMEPSERLHERVETLESEWLLVAKRLRIPESQANFKGRLTLYLLARRYDYAEFLKLIEGHDSATERLAHTHVQGLRRYVCCVVDPNRQDAKLPEDLSAFTAAAYVSGYRSVPEWFAIGLGQAAARPLRGRDAAIAWDREAAQLLSRGTDPQALLDGKLPSAETEVLGRSFAVWLLKRPQKLPALWAALESGVGWAEAIEKAFGAAPIALLTQWSAQIGSRGRGSRRP